ncbi:MAG: aconitate hydratase AcnA [Chloroflexota bacterium]
MTTQTDAFGARALLPSDGAPLSYYRLDALARAASTNLDRLPVTVKILLENVLRRHDGRIVTDQHVTALAAWDPTTPPAGEVPFLPARVVLQDFTGVPAVVDLAAMRSAVARMGGDPQRINPLVPADLVIDHSVQVDLFGSSLAYAGNVEREYERNRERYTLLRWGQTAFHNFRVVPPGTGIVHQVNLERLATVVMTRSEDGQTVAYPDTLVGTDSHTTMINGLGVLGWGVGGIEAEAVLLGQPLYMLTPQVVGFRMYGELAEGTTATDLVLTVTQILRKHGVVGKFVEYFGAGLGQLSLADRATLANMAPEYGATAGLFPVDDETLRYLRMTGRDESLIGLVERYTKEQGLFRTATTPDPHFTETLELDLSTVEASLAGPRRPQDRVPLSAVGRGFREAFPSRLSTAGTSRRDEASTGAGTATATRPVEPRVDVTFNGTRTTVGDGSVVIAAITSCTNTSNPSVMLGAGLLAKKAVERGLNVSPAVKTSMAPGSRVVTDYLEGAGLLPYLEALRFHVVGYGCTTCIGNSGPLPDAVTTAVRDNELVVAAVLSGNRNFEGRIHPLVRAAYLAAPPLVVAYALAGTVDIDLTRDPLGHDANGEPVYLRDLWPTAAEVRALLETAVTPELFRKNYANVFDGDDTWRALPVPEGGNYAWDSSSTYIQEPPFFQDLSPQPAPVQDIAGARVLVMLGDSITTDHISPAGSIAPSSPAGQYLVEHGVQPRDYNSYGARRGNHEVMMRGTFANVRLRNELAPGREGDWTIHLPDGDEVRIFEASERYRAEGTPLIVIAGKEYGSGSSRDWAAKGTLLLGVKAVLAESYERIHRSNLVGMGVLPLQFKAGEGRASLGLTGRETFDIAGLSAGLTPGQELTVRVRGEDGSSSSFQALARVDSPIEVDYLRHGGILQMVLRQLVGIQGQGA